MLGRVPSPEEQQARFRAVVESGFDALYVFDAVRDDAGAVVDFQYVEVNGHAAERLGRSPAQIIGRRLTDFFPLTAVQNFVTTWTRVMDSRQPSEEEAPTSVPVLNVTWVRLHTVPLPNGVAVTSRDISQQKRAQAALEASEEALRVSEAKLRLSHDELERRVLDRTAALTATNAQLTEQVYKRRLAEDRFSKLADSGLLAIAIANTAGAIFEVNDAFVKLVGYSRDELLSGAVHPEMLTPPSWAAADQLARDKLKAQGFAEPYEKEFVRRDGSRVPIQVGFTMLGGSELLVLVTDLTQRKRAEEALRQTEEQLRQSQKLEAIGSLAGGVAHDFNNLLTVILSYGSLVTKALRSGDPMRAEVGEMVAAAERAAVLTSQLLAFSRKQIMRPRVIVINEVATAIERMIHRLIGENIEVRMVPAPDLGPAMVDPSQLEQVLMNLAVNARDAMPDGGQLTIETMNVDLDEEYAAARPGVSPGPHVMLAVSDTGIGMDEQTRARIFEPFFTTKRAGKGTGLGLSTVFGIVAQSGGHIYVYSEPGKGTSFKIYFPRASAPPTSLMVAPRAELAHARGAETILLVEDDEAVRMLAKTVLNRFGYSVIEAENGGAALLICEQTSTHIDLLLTDVVMPRMTGRQLADRLKPLRPGLKVLYVSGYTENSIVHHGVLDPGINFLQKPLTVDALTQKVREVLDSPLAVST